MKLLTVPAVRDVSRATVILPSVVSNVADHCFPGSMHDGGAWAKCVVSGEDPSGLGHGVAPVMEAPAGAGGAVGGPPAANVVVVPAAVVAVPGTVVAAAASVVAVVLVVEPVLW